VSIDRAAISTLEGVRRTSKRSLDRNEAWMSSIIARRRQIIDIGIDRRRSPSARSPYYRVEQQVIQRTHYSRVRREY